MVFIKKIKQKKKIQLEPCNQKLFTREHWVSSVGGQLGINVLWLYYSDPLLTSHWFQKEREIWGSLTHLTYMLHCDILVNGAGDKLWERRFSFPRIFHTGVSGSLVCFKSLLCLKLWDREGGLSCLSLKCTRPKVPSTYLIPKPTFCFYLQS